MSAELTHAIRYAEAALDGADAQSSIVLGAALQRVLSALSTPPADDVREALATHACEECSTCGVHDGRHDKCCGCYDGVCCQEKREDLEVRERLYNILRWGTENDEMRTVDRILAEVRPRGTVTDAPSRPTQDGGVWGSYVAYLRDLEAHVAAF